MALVIDLKPFEKILIGTAVVTNDDQRTRLHISGDSPILRERDVMQEEDADSPCRRVYFLIQCMYLARNPQQYFDRYFELLRDVQAAAPSMTAHFLQINEMILSGSYYKAMKEARNLIKQEDEILGHVQQQQAV